MALMKSLVFPAHTPAQQREPQAVDLQQLQTGCLGPVTGSVQHRLTEESLQIYLIHRNKHQEGAKWGTKNQALNERKENSSEEDINEMKVSNLPDVDFKKKKKT